MEIIKASSRPTKKISSEYFTGIVWQDPIIDKTLFGRPLNRREFGL